MNILHVVLLVTMFFSPSFASSDTQTLEFRYNNHEVKNYQTWQNWKEKSIIQRISPAPKNVIEYITLDNQLYEYDGIPKQITIDPDFKKDLIDAINELPRSVVEQLKNNLIGIFILSGLGSTGYSEHIYNKGHYEGGFIALDQDMLLNVTANEWASWRINSAFLKDDDYKLSIKIEEHSTNTRKQAIQFILLHEISHIIGPAIDAHPRTFEGDPKQFSFSNISWISFYDSIFDHEFTNRKNIRLYRFDKSTISTKDADEIISRLKNTDFPSIYASNNFFEDFAEAYTIYTHTILMKKPYSLTLYHKDKEIQRFENPFMMKNLKIKKEYLDKLFGVSKN